MNIAAIVSRFHPRTASDVSLRLADRVIDTFELRERTGLLYRENLATYLYHAVGEKGADKLLASPLPPTVERIREHMQPMAAARWMIKIERDLAAPFQDAEVLDRLKQLDKMFHEEVLRLQQQSGGGSFRILINGSLCKGRMGKNSDIDGQVDTSNDAFRARLLERFQKEPHDNVSFWPLSAGGEGVTEEHISGPLLDLGDGSRLLADEHFLSKFYMGVMRSKGYVVVADHVERAVAPPPRKREARLVLEKFFELSRADATGNMHWRLLKNWSFRAAGCLLPKPVVGAAVGWCLEQLVPSR